jgi:hypothetical protein
LSPGCSQASYPEYRKTNRRRFKSTDTSYKW